MWVWGEREVESKSTYTNCFQRHRGRRKLVAYRVDMGYIWFCL